MTEVEPLPVVQQLREAIRASGLSLARLGAAAGIAPGQLSRFVRGERGLTLASAALVCQTLGITLTVPEPPRGTTGGGQPVVPPRH
jgi:transcriptional regulator with XRE-family HTH domain